jgi:hypothetical protein
MLDFGHPQNGFDTETVSALEIAFDRATRRFQGEHYNDLRLIIARRIVVIAQSGERDPDRLYKSALASIGFRG